MGRPFMIPIGIEMKRAGGLVGLVLRRVTIDGVDMLRHNDTIDDACWKKFTSSIVVWIIFLWIDGWIKQALVMRLHVK